MDINIISSADAVDKHLEQLSTHSASNVDSNDDDDSDLQQLPIDERALTGIVNDKRLTELLNNCDDFLQTYGNIHDERD